MGAKEVLTAILICGVIVVVLWKGRRTGRRC
jgi:hypothetical protein